VKCKKKNRRMCPLKSIELFSFFSFMKQYLNFTLPDRKAYEDICSVLANVLSWARPTE
jgi:hypothetical protein